MREILFRGKSVDTKQWEYGQLIKGKYYLGLTPITALMTPQLIFYPQCEVNGWAEVFPETVGQFTGLTDKNGKKIFEGDLIRHYNQSNHPEAYDLYRIEFDVRGCMWVGRYNDNYAAQLRNYLGEHYEVVGNIHDNPELLELPKGE